MRAGGSTAPLPGQTTTAQSAPCQPKQLPPAAAPAPASPLPGRRVAINRCRRTQRSLYTNDDPRNVPALRAAIKTSLDRAGPRGCAV